MQYGHFDNTKREYVITNPQTPLPWINYLGSDEFCGLISANAGGYCFYKDPLLRRLLRYRYNNVPMDMGGRYLYLRDNDTSDFWSMSWMPVKKSLDKYKYECRHGMGYTWISSEYEDIEASTLFFVPKNENNEVWHCRIKNNSDRKRNLSMFSFVEFCLYNALKDQTDYQYTLSIGVTKVEDSVIYHVTNYKSDEIDENKYREDYNTDAVDIFTYFSCSEKIENFDTQRLDFLGDYGSLEAPKAVVENKCSNSIASGWNPVGVHHLDIELIAGEEKEITFVLGVAKKFGDEKLIIEKYKNSFNVEEEMEKLRKYWDENLSTYQAETPDEDINTMTNIWNQYQCRTTFNWSRSASFYESGIGRGMGFRDSCQDILGFVHMIPKEARERLIDIASTQFETGDAYHQYQPLTKKGAGSGFSDDHLWLIIATAQYIKESGDFDVLNEVVPYRCGLNSESGTLYEHLNRAVEFTMSHLGEHGLPLMLYADWNDAFHRSRLDDNMESVFVAMLFIYSVREMVEIAELKNDIQAKERFTNYIDKIYKAVNDFAWDGKWFAMGYSDILGKFGSKVNEEGKTWLLPQAWAVLAGASDNERLTKAMDSVNESLATEHGIVLFDPAYTNFSSAVGHVSFYIPGLKENAAVFCHSNPWAIIAETKLGRGDKAYEYHKALLPSTKNDISALRKTEPYVYCQMVAGKAHRNSGEGKNSWLTGTAAWSFFAISSFILGVRAGYKGLELDPVVPKHWKYFKVCRKFRGSEYDITFNNPRGVCKGIKSIKVNGSLIDGNVISYEAKGKKYFVEVEMG